MINYMTWRYSSNKIVEQCEVPATEKRPSFWQLVGLFALVFLLGKLFSRFGLLKPNVSLDSSLSFGAVFVLGLVAASSSCIAVSGGLMLSVAAQFSTRMRPVIMFVAGRIVSYTILGGIIGLIGKAFSPSPLVTGMITVIAAVYMFVMGLEMLHLAPHWLKARMPRMPKKISHAVLNQEGSTHPLAPIVLGAGTFFLPCGFTQALQLYALTTGSFVQSALILFAFALGTAPALLGLGWASGSLKGKAGRFFFRFSGALIIVLGIWNIQNGFTIAGHPLRVSSRVEATAATVDPNVTFDGKEQIVTMRVGPQGYQPNNITIRAGVPTKWVVDGTNGGGCLSVLQAPSLGIRQLLTRGQNIITFTPRETGTIQFSCSMGMYRGQFNVIRI